DVMLVDSHCHLDFADFATGRDAVVARARAAGVGTMLTIGTRLDEFPAVRTIAETYDDVWCSVGAHPHEAADHAATTAAKLAEAALDVGFFISISGIVTFKNADELRAIVRDVPLDRLLVETDAPYLAPVPYRGKRNEPAFVAATAAAVAALKGLDPEELALATTDNFFRLFQKA